MLREKTKGEAAAGEGFPEEKAKIDVSDERSVVRERTKGEAAAAGEGYWEEKAKIDVFELLEPAVKRKKVKQRTVPIPSVVQTAASKANRKERRLTMKLKLLQPSELRSFEPDELDRDFESTSLPPVINWKWGKAVANLEKIRPESLQVMREGWLPAHKPDCRYVPGSWKNYLAGARAVMTLLMKNLKLKTIHYHQFFAFGTVDLLQPRDITTLIDSELTSGNDKLWALVAYQLIQVAQSHELTKAKLSFSPLIPEAIREGLTPVQLQYRCWELGETFWSSVTNVMNLIRDSKSASSFRNEQACHHTANVEIKESLLGNKVLDPAEVVPSYLQDSSVRDQTSELIAAAADRNLIPTVKQMKQFTNTVLVQLMIKNCSRREVFLGLTQGEFVEAKEAGLQCVHFVPNDSVDKVKKTGGSGGGGKDDDGLEVRTATVYDLGKDVGKFKMVLRPVEANKDKDPSQQGLVVQKKLHKTGDRGVAFGPD